jgi:hypothetical protein
MARGGVTAGRHRRANTSPREPYDGFREKLQRAQLRRAASRMSDIAAGKRFPPSPSSVSTGIRPAPSRDWLRSCPSSASIRKPISPSSGVTEPPSAELHAKDRRKGGGRRGGRGGAERGEVSYPPPVKNGRTQLDKPPPALLTMVQQAHPPFRLVHIQPALHTTEGPPASAPGGSGPV